MRNVNLPAARAGTGAALLDVLPPCLGTGLPLDDPGNKTARHPKRTDDSVRLACLQATTGKNTTLVPRYATQVVAGRKLEKSRIGGGMQFQSLRRQPVSIGPDNTARVAWTTGTASLEVALLVAVGV